MRRLTLGWWAAFAAVLFLLLAALSPPWVPPTYRAVVMTAFSPACHQFPDRSPFIDGVQLAVCHRCMGVYVGLVLGVLLQPVLGQRLDPYSRAGRRLFLLALGLAAADWLGGIAGFWENTAGTRIFTGGLFGTVGGLFVAAALGRLSEKKPSGPSEAAKSS